MLDRWYYTGVVETDFTECGGSITITWTASTGCDNESVQATATIPVTPAAVPEIAIPTMPTSLTCDEAAAFTPPTASYDNGATGTCNISGEVDGVKSDDFTICGGTITITYTVCLLYTSPSPRDRQKSRMPSSA